ncbi:unnamed protein product [Heterosigma akashiwo]
MDPQTNTQQHMLDPFQTIGGSMTMGSSSSNHFPGQEAHANNNDNFINTNNNVFSLQQQQKPHSETIAGNPFG